MKLIDLSYSLSSKMATYPTDPKIHIKQEKSIKSNGSKIHSFSMGTHSGTHLDTPAHIFESGKNLDDFNLDHFTGVAIKFDKKTIGNIKDINFKFDGLIYETGWSKKFSNPKIFYGSSRPIITIDIVKMVFEYKLKFFGCDLPSVDKSGSKNKIVHNLLLKKNIIIYECLNNLEKLPLGIPFQFYGFPLSLYGLDGSPVRAVAKLKY